MGVLLGITGAIGSGKTTFSAFLAESEPNHKVYETWHVVAEIAQAFNHALKAELAFETSKDNLELANQALIWLPEAISEHLHYDLVWNQLAISKRDTLAKANLYEKLWTYLKLVRSHKKLLEMPIVDANKSTFRPILQWIGGYMVAKASKTIWYDEILRRIELHDQDKNLVIINGLRYPTDADVVRLRGGKIIEVIRPSVQSYTNDPTEEKRNEIKTDIAILNNGTPDQLKSLSQNLYSDLQINTIKQHYEAT